MAVSWNLCIVCLSHSPTGVDAMNLFRAIWGQALVRAFVLFFPLFIGMSFVMLLGYETGGDLKMVVKEIGLAKGSIFLLVYPLLFSVLWVWRKPTWRVIRATNKFLNEKSE